ncbi:HAD-IIB family hydrolase [Candidatus Daviesbacteria bacterium]|nr:HAD-IIB family hydrolase [Candidatus Daviesbacteria bacterium]
MVKLIVLDVDGVIVGHKIGVNFPYPPKKVIDALKQVRQKGIPVVLCSGKFHHAIEPLIKKAGLNNPHITNSGSLIINPLEEGIVETFYLDNNLVSNIIDTCIKNNIHIEAFSEKGIIIQKGSSNEYILKRSRINQSEPIIVDSLVDEAKKHKIFRLTAIAFNKADRQKIEKGLKNYNGLIKSVWTLHPYTNPWEYFLMTALNASKATSLIKTAKNLGISLDDALGVGDTLGDWEFMNLCGYVATMEDASEDLKSLVKTKGEGKYLIAPSVDQNGIINIFNYFL